MAQRRITIILCLAVVVGAALAMRSYVRSQPGPTHPSGWDKTVWGMTEDQVAALYPEAEHIHFIANPNYSTCSNGSYFGLRMPYTMGAFHFQASLCFDAEKRIDQVHLADLGRFDYPGIHKLLQARFGSPTRSAFDDTSPWYSSRFTDHQGMRIELNESSGVATVVYFSH